MLDRGGLERSADWQCRSQLAASAADSTNANATGAGDQAINSDRGCTSTSERDNSSIAATTSGVVGTAADQITIKVLAPALAVMEIAPPLTINGRC